MSQISDAFPVDRREPILCAYRNQTNSVQIIRITNLLNWDFEKIVFPRQLVLLETLPEAKLEVYVGLEGHATLQECISCDCLQVIVKNGD